MVLMDSIHPYHPNDLFVLGSNMPHLFKSEETDKSTSKMYTLFFTKESFGNEFFNLLELQQLKSFFVKARNGFKVVEGQKDLGPFLQKLEDKNRLDRFLGLLYILNRFCEVPTKSLSLWAPTKIRSLDEGERLQRIFDLVIQNFQRPISLEEVAELTFMTKNSFCRFFKKHTNKSFFDFLIAYRIEHACLQLAQSKTSSIMEIAEACGFQSQSNFNRRFKETKGITPRAFRANIH